MMCEICGKNAATMHLTTIINGEKKEKNICLACAQKQNNDFAQAFDIGQLLSGFMQENAAPSVIQQVCPHCGMDYRKFKQGGLLGCAHCYETFSGHLQPLLTRVHGHVNHTGKVPARMGGTLRSRREIEHLTAQMRKAIGLEQFEEAAKLRDQIRELQNKLEGGSAHEQ